MNASVQPSELEPNVASAPSTAPAFLAGVVTRGGQRVAESLTARGGPTGRQEWLAVAGHCQALINTLTAVQDAALAEVARREGIWCEDGTLGEAVHPPGAVALDAADLAAPLLGASHAQAQRRLEQAVRLAANRVPVPAEVREVPEHAGLSGLHAAMAQGRLDGYRAGVVAFELELAPAQVSDAVLTALESHLGEDAPTLRRRTRRLVARICPDLLRQRAQRARAATGLRRWVAEPGVDAWYGTFPSEDAATAWAAIDHLAHDLLTNGTCTTIEQARGKALTDLVTSNATIDVQLLLTVPADAAAPDTPTAPAPAPAAVPPSSAPRAADEDPVHAEPTGHSPAPRRSDEDLVQVRGARPSEPLLVRRGWLREHLPKQPLPPERGRGSTARQLLAPCDPHTGARLDVHDQLATDTYRPSTALIALVKARDGHCRFPGCSIAARFCDLDHVRPWPTGPTTTTNLLTLCRRHHRIKQRPGWRVHLTPDATTTWTDPTGRTRTTTPLDALETLVLTTDPAEPTHTPSPTPTTPSTCPRTLETHHQIRTEHLNAHLEHWSHAQALPPTHRHCTTTADLRAGHAHRRTSTTLPEHPPF